MNRTPFAFIGALIVWTAIPGWSQANPALRNKELTVRVRAQDGFYEILSHDLQQPVLVSAVGA